MDLERSMGAAQEIFSTSSWAQSIMALRAKGLVKKLGWRGFLRLLVHLPKFLKLFGRLTMDARVSLAPKLVSWEYSLMSSCRRTWCRIFYSV